MSFYSNIFRYSRVLQFKLIVFLILKSTVTFVTLERWATNFVILSYLRSSGPVRNGVATWKYMCFITRPTCQVSKINKSYYARHNTFWQNEFISFLIHSPSAVVFSSTERAQFRAHSQLVSCTTCLSIIFIFLIYLNCLCKHSVVY